jgi:hypothetical protein
LNEKKNSKILIKLEESIKKNPNPKSEISKEKQYFAELQGVFNNYKIEKEVVSIGRKNESFDIDIDLSEEKNSKKLSRKHAEITLQKIDEKSSNFLFKIKNLAKKEIFVNNIPLKMDEERKILDNSTISFLKETVFYFKINKPYIEQWLN